MEGGGDHREARRPMNSFFIFCKRHRSMVRDYHHNLDNRSISRILGELWATLDPKQKQQYTATAKQYKDAFLKANPDYKWHNNDKSHLMSNNYALNQELTDPDKNNEKMECYNESPDDSNNMDVLFMAIQQNNKEDFATQVLNENKNDPHIADAAGESSLLSRKDNVCSSTTLKHEPGNEDESIEYTVKQDWTYKDEESCIHIPHSKFPEYPAKDSSPSTSSPTHTSKDGNESDGSKSHQSDASGDVNWTKISGFDNCRQADYIYREVHVPTRKSKRTNKGAIYKNLIATGALPASRERLAEIQTIYNVNSDDGSEIKETPFHEQPIRRIKRTASESDTHPDKRYKTGDFDLDAKIATLPACSMDVLEKNRKNVTRPKSSPENSRRPSGGISTHVMKTDMLLAPPRRQRHLVSSSIVGSRKRKQSKDSIMRIVPLSEEYRHRLSYLMKVPLATFYLHPSMKSYQDLLVQKSASSSPDQAASTSDDSFECKENSCVAVEVEPSIKKAEKVINIPTITATSTLTLSTTTKIAATSNFKESIEEKPSLHSAAVKADCIPVATVPHPTCSVFVTPPMSNVYQASVSSVDISLRSTQVTDISAQMAAAHTSNIPLAAVAAAAVVSEPTQNPASMELGPTSSGLHVSGELKVKLGNQSPKQSKLSENPDFKIWISNLAEAAERTGQISVC